MKKLLITFCLLFSTASFASYGLENLIYFSNEIVQAKFLWNEVLSRKHLVLRKHVIQNFLLKKFTRGGLLVIFANCTDE